MALSHYMDRSTLTFFIVTALACLERLISTAIITRLATTQTAAPNFPLAVTASVFEIFAFFTLVAAVGLFLRRVSRNLLMIAWLPGAAFCSVGTLLALISLALTIHYTTREDVYGGPRDLAVTGLIIAVLGLIPQTTFYVLIWPRMKQSDLCTVDAHEDRPSPTQSEKHRSIAVHLAALSPARASFFKSSADPTRHSHADYHSTTGSHSRHPMKALQPMSSRTRLLLRASFASRDSRSIHSRADSAATFEPARTNSDFENWDTSGVEAFGNPFAQKTFLEPIPGSRPASPANPLDGPFLVEPEETPLPESPVHSPASECGASLRNFRRPSEHEETYYHPLFRVRPESPAPPLASPGTVITASPFAGQIISPELVAPRMLHSAASSRPASPGILSPARSHAGSIRSFRTVPTSPIESSELRTFSQTPRAGSVTSCRALSPLELETRGRSQLSGSQLPP